MICPGESFSLIARPRAFIYSHGPLGPVSTGVLLDLPVRTDTKGVSGGFKGVVSDPFLPIRCEVCFKPLSLCCCIPGKYY